MTSPDSLTTNQIAQRIDELKGLQDAPADKVAEVIASRLEELNRRFDYRMKGNINKGIVTPLPPDKLDVDNDSIITPKSPQQVEREQEAWLSHLES
jgi:hypothetical protein